MPKRAASAKSDKSSNASHDEEQPQPKQRRHSFSGDENGGPSTSHYSPPVTRNRAVVRGALPLSQSEIVIKLNKFDSQEEPIIEETYIISSSSSSSSSSSVCPRSPASFVSLPPPSDDTYIVPYEVSSQGSSADADVSRGSICSNDTVIAFSNNTSSSSSSTSSVRSKSEIKEEILNTLPEENCLITPTEPVVKEYISTKSEEENSLKSNVSTPLREPNGKEETSKQLTGETANETVSEENLLEEKETFGKLSEEKIDIQSPKPNVLDVPIEPRIQKETPTKSACQNSLATEEEVVTKSSKEEVKKESPTKSACQNSLATKEEIVTKYSKEEVKEGSPTKSSVLVTLSEPENKENSFEGNTEATQIVLDSKEDGLKKSVGENSLESPKFFEERATLSEYSKPSEENALEGKPEIKEETLNKTFEEQKPLETIVSITLSELERSHTKSSDESSSEPNVIIPVVKDESNLKSEEKPLETIVSITLSELESNHTKSSAQDPSEANVIIPIVTEASNLKSSEENPLDSNQLVPENIPETNDQTFINSFAENLDATVISPSAKGESNLKTSTENPAYSNLLIAPSVLERINKTFSEFSDADFVITPSEQEIEKETPLQSPAENSLEEESNSKTSAENPSDSNLLIAPSVSERANETFTEFSEADILITPKGVKEETPIQCSEENSLKEESDSKTSAENPSDSNLLIAPSVSEKTNETLTEFSEADILITPSEPKVIQSSEEKSLDVDGPISLREPEQKEEALPEENKLAKSDVLEEQLTSRSLEEKSLETSKETYRKLSSPRVLQKVELNSKSSEEKLLVQPSEPKKKATHTKLLSKENLLEANVLIKTKEPSEREKTPELSGSQEDKEHKMGELNERQLQMLVSDLQLQLNAAQQDKATLELEIRQKEEVVLKAQVQAQKNEQALKQEIKQLKEKLKEKSKISEEDQIKELEKALKESKDKEAKAVAELNAKLRDDLNYKKVMEEYERNATVRLAEFEKLKQEHETAAGHLANLELAFSDVHQKYERSKAIIDAFKASEETMKFNLQCTEEKLQQTESKYESLKTYAQTQIEKSNKEIHLNKEKYEIETTKLRALIKRLEIKCSSLETSLHQKIEECSALSELCDHITGKPV